MAKYEVDDMELRWKTCLRAGVTAGLLFLAIHYWTAFTGLAGVALGAAKPLLWGCAIAYVVNIPMRFLERHVEPKCKKETAKKLCRPICMVLAFLCIFLIAVLIVQMIVPELIGCLQILLEELPGVLDNIAVWMEDNQQINGKDQTDCQGNDRRKYRGNNTCSRSHYTAEAIEQNVDDFCECLLPVCLTALKHAVLGCQKCANLQVVGAFMIFTISPVKAIIFIVFLVALQQLEGNLIYPRVVGSSIGLPGVWVLAAVTVGGGVIGVGGMLLGVPLAAAAYQLLKNDMNAS